MLTCEGYKMFYGAATVTPKNPEFKPFELVGTWLYKPDCDCWYCAGHAYPAAFVTDMRELSHD